MIHVAVIIGTGLAITGLIGAIHKRRSRTITSHMNKIEPYSGCVAANLFKKKDKKLSIVNPPLQSEVGGVKEHFFIYGLRLFLLIPLCLFIFSPLKHLILNNID